MIGPARNPEWPDAPSTKELGYDINVSVDTWWFAPKGTPKVVVGKLADAIERAMADPGLKEALAKQGVAQDHAARRCSSPGTSLQSMRQSSRWAPRSAGNEAGMADPQRRARRADIGFTALVLVVATVFLVQAWKLPASRFDPLGPGAFPIGICRSADSAGRRRLCTYPVRQGARPGGNLVDRWLGRYRDRAPAAARPRGLCLRRDRPLRRSLAVHARSASSGRRRSSSRRRGSR